MHETRQARELGETRAISNEVFETCIHPKGARRQRAESVGRSRAAFGFGFWASTKRASQEAVAGTVDEPGPVSTHLDTAVAVRIESVANRGRIGCIHSKPAFVPAPIAGQRLRNGRSARI